VQGFVRMEKDFLLGQKLVLEGGKPVTSWNRFWWEGGHEGHLQGPKGKAMNPNKGTEGCGTECEVESETLGTASLFRCIFSAVVKSLSQKCLLHKYFQRSIFDSSMLQVLPTLPVHTTAL
jgi:hypothetical protein